MENSEYWSLSTEGVFGNLLLVCSCRKLFERFFKLVEIENFDFFWDN